MQDVVGMRLVALSANDCREICDIFTTSGTQPSDGVQSCKFRVRRLADMARRRTGAARKCRTPRLS